MNFSKEKLYFSNTARLLLAAYFDISGLPGHSTVECFSPFGRETNTCNRNTIFRLSMKYFMTNKTIKTVQG